MAPPDVERRLGRIVDRRDKERPEDGEDDEYLVRRGEPELHADDLRELAHCYPLNLSDRLFAPSPTSSTKILCSEGETTSNLRTETWLEKTSSRVWGLAPSTSSISTHRGKRDTLRTIPGQGPEIDRAVELHDDRIVTVARLDVGKGARDHLAAVIDDEDPRADPLRNLHVVRGEEDGLAPAAELEDRLPQHVRAHRVEARERLVEEEELRVVENGGDELYLLRHALGEASGVRVFHSARSKRASHSSSLFSAAELSAFLRLARYRSISLIFTLR